jgi:hypothetical protein
MPTAEEVGFMQNLFTTVLTVGLLLGSTVPTAAETATTRGFTFSLEVVLPGSPAQVYDAVTGDISPWWDHTIQQDPLRLEIEAHPGGGFWEIFDENGDGVRHAVVTGARRGEWLRFEGPLGLAGRPLAMVHTYRLEAVGDSTRLRVEVGGHGVIEEGLPKVVERVWRHFLFGRLEPYLRGERGQ